MSQEEQEEIDFSRFKIVQKHELKEKKVKIIEFNIICSDNSDENKDSVVKVVNNLTYKEEARVIIADVRGDTPRKIDKFIKKFKQEYKNSQVIKLN